MNNKLYNKLIFELSTEGRKAVSLPKNEFGDYELCSCMKRAEDAALPECDEMTVVRHYTNHSANNFGVNNGFYPLGSCTMKYNPQINEEVAAMPQFAKLHPSQPADTCQGALEAYDNLQKMLSALTGLSKFTLNPFAGAHGELTGLMVIRAYHESRGDMKRTKVIVPDSAHGTNPASAAVCGLDIVEVKSTKDGLVDVEHLKTLLSDEIAAMMMTNPNTLGLFEPDIPEIQQLIHDCGGLMYYDGANLNPMLGASRPGDMGFDVMHINLHKTFATPHGGGGPGCGPVGVRAGLEQFLPAAPGIDNQPPTSDTQHPITDTRHPIPDTRFSTPDNRTSAPDNQFSTISVSAALNFSVILKAYAYILSLGKENVKLVGPLATLNANYIKERLRGKYLLPIDRICKHEFVFDGLVDKSTGVTTMDIAKRLLDYGYHAPTIYFPLLFHESLMIEPTETESKDTIDQFCEVMLKIAEEAATNPELVKTAPHTTPIGRVDDVLAAKQTILTYQ